jgi:protein SCO1/2
MSKNTSKNIVFVLAAAVAMIAGVWLGANNEPSQNTNRTIEIQGVILPTAKTIRAFQLTDHLEQAFTLDALQGQWSLLFVGYTQCPDVCPAALSVLKQVHQLMTEQSLSVPEVVFISVDPQRDTYPLLAKYVSYFNAEFIGVTGEIDQLKNITRQLSVSFAKAPGSSGNINSDDYLMDHSSSFILINPQGKLQSYLTPPHMPMKIIDSIIRSQAYYRQNESF